MNFQDIIDTIGNDIPQIFLQEEGNDNIITKALSKTSNYILQKKSHAYMDSFKTKYYDMEDKVNIWLNEIFIELLLFVLKEYKRNKSKTQQHNITTTIGIEDCCFIETYIVKTNIKYRLEEEGRIDFHFKKLLQKEFDNSVLFTLLYDKQRSCSYSDALHYMIRFFCIYIYYQYIKKKLQCLGIYYFHSFFDDLSIEKSDSLVATIKKLEGLFLKNVSPKIYMIEKNSQQNFQSCGFYSDSFIKNHHVDIRVVKDNIDKEPSYKQTVTMRKIKAYKEESLKVKQIIKQLEKSIDKKTIGILNFLVETSCFHLGEIKTRSILQSIEFLLPMHNRCFLLKDFQSTHLSRMIRQNSSSFSYLNLERFPMRKLAPYYGEIMRIFISNMANQSMNMNMNIDNHAINTISSMCEKSAWKDKDKDKDKVKDKKKLTTFSESDVRLYYVIRSSLLQLFEKHDNNNSIVELYKEYFLRIFLENFILELNKKMKKFEIRVYIIDNIEILDKKIQNANIKKEIKQIKDNLVLFVNNKEELLLFEKIMSSRQLFFDLFNTRDFSEDDVNETFWLIFFGKTVNIKNTDVNIHFVKNLMNNCVDCSVSLDEINFLDDHMKYFLFSIHGDFMKVLKQIEKDIFAFEHTSKTEWNSEIEMILFTRLQELYHPEQFFRLFHCITD